MFSITTPPVFSRTVAASQLPAALSRHLPAGWRLSAHQLETYQAVVGGEYDVVVNTALTGDGKSLAAFLPALVHEESLMAMYPTNELSRDQQIHLPHMMNQWRCRLESPKRMSAAVLDEMVRSNKLRHKGLAIDLLADHNEIVLTNPDIFHYLAQFFYTSQGDAPDKRFMRHIVDNFEQFIFDEFHVFQAPQIVSVVNALLLLREFSKRRKQFLFLSATPNDELIDYLTRADFKVKVVSTTSSYQHTRQTPDLAQWRPIIWAATIAFDRLSPDRPIERWVSEHRDAILRFFQEQPVAKGAIIVNSVASAYRLKAQLEGIFRAAGFNVELNTGLTDESLKEVSRAADLLIGTSTVDVGIDFRINLLIFESLDAGTFLQRLGRLGRHEKDDHGRSFSTYQAYALVPNYIAERLFVGKGQQPPILENGGVCDREALAGAIYQAYPPPARFQSYGQEWGWIQSTHVLYRLSNAAIRESYAPGRQNLARYYQKLFHFSASQKLGEYLQLRKDSRSRLLLDEARSFRGDSPLQCGIIDMTEQGGPKQYSLITLLANGRLQWLDPQEFSQIARRSWGDQLLFDVDDLLGWFRFYGFTDERRKVSVQLNHRIGTWESSQLGVAQVLSGITLECDVEWINSLNRHMRQRQFVVTLCRQHPAALRPLLYLPPMFRLYEYRDLENQVGSIAFAREALLLHIALQQRSVACAGAMIL